MLPKSNFTLSWLLLACDHLRDPSTKVLCLPSLHPNTTQSRTVSTLLIYVPKHTIFTSIEASNLDIILDFLFLLHLYMHDCTATLSL